MKQPNVICEYCAAAFYAPPSRLKNNRHFHCSAACYGAHRTQRSPTHRFWQKVAKGGDAECWEWIGSYGNHGYGQLTIKYGDVVTAPRFSYALHQGPIPEGMHVRHKCDNYKCVNPAHLELGTHAQNMRDFWERGHGNRGSSNGMSKLTEAQAALIRADPRQNHSAIARDFGVGPRIVRDIRNGRRWAHRTVV